MELEVVDSFHPAKEYLMDVGKIIEIEVDIS